MSDQPLHWCFVCKMDFPNHDAMNEHYSSTHFQLHEDGSYNDTYSCRKCLVTFPNLERYQIHQMCYHNNQNGRRCCIQHSYTVRFPGQFDQRPYGLGGSVIRHNYISSLVVQESSRMSNGDNESVRLLDPVALSLTSSARRFQISPALNNLTSQDAAQNQMIDDIQTPSTTIPNQET